MRKLWAVVAGAALVCAGCPVADMAGTPEWTTYGKIKADVAINTNGAAFPAAGDWTQYVVDTAPEPDGTLSMQARDSRFGARLDMGAVKGRVEVDFHDNDVLFRHAYVTLDLGNDMTLLAGQTSDVFSPLCPSVLNYFAGWNVGNVGHRSPQVRWEWAPEMGLIESVQAALSDPNDTSIGFPDIQARVGFRVTERLKLGGSIVIGNTDTDDDNAEEDVFGMAADVRATFSDKFAIVGEWFTGHNLSDYMGNIGLPANFNPPGPGPVAPAEIGADGLWVAVEIKTTDKLTVNAGMMFDSNDDDDLAGTGFRENNSCLFGNAIWKLNENTDVGIEISKWETEYEGDTTDYDNLRIQGSVIVKF